jgi:hypothetical protein
MIGDAFAQISFEPFKSFCQPNAQIKAFAIHASDLGHPTRVTRLTLNRSKSRHRTQAHFHRLNGLLLTKT